MDPTRRGFLAGLLATPIALVMGWWGKPWRREPLWVMPRKWVSRSELEVVRVYNEPAFLSGRAVYVKEGEDKSRVALWSVPFDMAADKMELATIPAGATLLYVETFVADPNYTCTFSVGSVADLS